MNAYSAQLTAHIERLKNQQINAEQAKELHLRDEAERQEAKRLKDKVDDLYNLFSYAEQDEDVLNMTGGKPLIGWLREREEEWYKTQGETK